MTDSYFTVLHQSHLRILATPSPRTASNRCRWDRHYSRSARYRSPHLAARSTRRNSSRSDRHRYVVEVDWTHSDREYHPRQHAECTGECIEDLQSDFGGSQRFVYAALPRSANGTYALPSVLCYADHFCAVNLSADVPHLASPIFLRFEYDAPRHPPLLRRLLSPVRQRVPSRCGYCIRGSLGREEDSSRRSVFLIWVFL